jgi:hypothetical protein
VLRLYIEAWLLTVAIESPVVACVYRGQRARMFGVCVAATTATHAFMHFLLPRLVDSLETWIVVGEAIALVVEAVAYAVLAKGRSVPRALVASALANGLSYATGLLVFG